MPNALYLVYLFDHTSQSLSFIWNDPYIASRRLTTWGIIVSVMSYYGIVMAEGQNILPPNIAAISMALLRHSLRHFVWVSLERL